MSLGAFLDAERTDYVHARDLNVEECRGLRLYCNNPNCDAHMVLRRRENTLYFAASPNSGPHADACPYHLCGLGEFNPRNYNMNFKMANLLRDMLTPTEQSAKHPDRKSSNGQYAGKHLPNPRTLKIIYLLCKSYLPSFYLGNRPIYETLLDNRSIFHYHKASLDGVRIVECYPRERGNIYERTNSEMYLSVSRDTEKIDVTITFGDSVLFRNTCSKFFDSNGHILRNKLVVLLGEWAEIDSRHISAKITNKKQILIF